MPVEMTRFIGLIQSDLNALGKLGEVKLEMLAVGGQDGAGQPFKYPGCIAFVIKPGNLRPSDAFVLTSADKAGLAETLGFGKLNDGAALGKREHLRPLIRIKHVILRDNASIETSVSLRMPNVSLARDLQVEIRRHEGDIALPFSDAPFPTTLPCIGEPTLALRGIQHS